MALLSFIICIKMFPMTQTLRYCTLQLAFSSNKTEFKPQYGSSTYLPCTFMSCFMWQYEMYTEIQLVIITGKA